MIGLQRLGQEPELVSYVRDDFESLLAPDLGCLEGWEATMVGMGGGFADMTFPAFDTPSLLSNFTNTKESRTPLVGCEMVDDFLTHESMASLSSWSIPTNGLDFDHDHDYDFDSTPVPSAFS